MHIVGACREPYDSDLLNKLIEPNAFRDHFKVKVTANQDRWHVFVNNFDNKLLADILNEFEVLKYATTYLIGNVEVDDDEVFAFLHRINTISVTLKGVSLEDDSLKRLTRLLWQMLAGFSWADGYQDDNYFDNMFRKI